MFEKIKLWNLERELRKQGFERMDRVKDDLELSTLLSDFYCARKDWLGYRVDEKGRVSHKLDVYIHELSISNVRSCSERYLVFFRSTYPDNGSDLSMPPPEQTVVVKW